MARYTGPLGLGLGRVLLSVVNCLSPRASFFNHWFTVGRLGSGVDGKFVEAAPEETPEVLEESVDVVEQEL